MRVILFVMTMLMAAIKIREKDRCDSLAKLFYDLLEVKKLVC